jgi:RNA polymerase sigma-70 factor (ECF subfamily)
MVVTEAVTGLLSLTHNTRIDAKLSQKSTICHRFRSELNGWAPQNIKVLKHGENRFLHAQLTTRGREAKRGLMPAVADIPGDEARWIRMAQASDPRAFEKLYRAHVDRIYGLCLRMTGNPSEAEDCTQDAFIQAWNKLEKFRGDSAFGTWMHRVAVNTVLGRMRKSRREQDRIRAVSDLDQALHTVADDGELRDLEQAINELPSGARHVFVLHAVYGYSHGETGDMLGIAEGTSKAQLNRARRLLAQQLDTESA